MDRFECAVASAQRDEPVFATASHVRAWLLVEVRGSWGRDAVGDSEFGPHAPKIWRTAMGARGIRIVAIRRDLDRRHEHPVAGLRLVHIVAGRPGGPPSVAHRRVIDDLHHVVAATESIVAGHGPDEHWSVDAEPYVLVCTNGRHDPCCATQGRPLVRHLRGTRWGARLWECSHIGGDRFAGNVVLLPESLYFGRCGPIEAERLLSEHEAGRIELSSLRGRSTLSLVEQAAEHFVRNALGARGLDDVVGIASVEPGLVRVDVRSDEPAGVATMVVEVGRTMRAAPTALTCKGVEGLSYPTYRTVEVRPRT